MNWNSRSALSSSAGALVVVGRLEQRGPGVARAAPEVRRDDVGRHAVGGQRLRALAEALEVGLGRRLAVDQPADDQVDVPAHPRAQVLAQRPEALVLGAIPEAVDHALGELVEVGALDDPADRLSCLQLDGHLAIMHMHNQAVPKFVHAALCSARRDRNDAADWERGGELMARRGSAGSRWQ